MVIAFCSLKPLPTPLVKTFSTVFFCKFIVLAFKFGPVVHFGLRFVCGLTQKSTGVLSVWEPCSSTVVRETLLPYWIPLALVEDQITI